MELQEINSQLQVRVSYWRVAVVVMMLPPMTVAMKMMMMMMMVMMLVMMMAMMMMMMVKTMISWQATKRQLATAEAKLKHLTADGELMRPMRQQVAEVLRDQARAMPPPPPPLPVINHSYHSHSTFDSF
jgi:hypothetical protein